MYILKYFCFSEFFCLTKYQEPVRKVQRATSRLQTPNPAQKDLQSVGNVVIPVVEGK